MMLLFCMAALTQAQQQDVNPDNAFMNLSIEDLGQLDVTSVTGVTENWFQSPAAVYVITQDDIQRTGHQSIADLLRMVPGVNVAQISSNNWTVGTRGLQGSFTDSMLMLVDGRSVYDPLQFVIRWDTQDMILDDILNIEVIRGPGTTLWGSNAINGVVSLTTKPASQTQGWLLDTVIGSHEQPSVSLRYGDKIEDNMHFRIWSKYANREAFKHTDGSDAPDDWDMFRTGFRFDVDAPDHLTWSMQGGFYHTDQLGGDSNLPDPSTSFATTNIISDGRISSGYLQATISQQPDEKNKWTVMAAYDRTARATHDGFESLRDIIDLDYRQRYAINENHLLIWGASWQYTSDHTESSPAVTFTPQDKCTNLLTTFIQSSMQFFDDKLALVIGSKFEHNNYTGFEFHPSARLSWTPDINNNLWASVSRAVRTPGRVNTSSQITPFYADTGLLAGGPPSGILVPLTIGNGQELESEVLIAYEMGYRMHLGHDLLIDWTGYINDYDNLITSSATNFGQLTNDLQGQIFGSEISVVYHPAPTWRIETGYGYCRSFLQGDRDTVLETSFPTNQFHLRSYLDIGSNIELNAGLYYVDKTQVSDSYIRLDCGLTWQLKDNMSISVWGQNLLDNQHAEFFDQERSAEVSEVPRAIYARLRMTF
ncbi:MAG: TonB-dependent receptor plug domain-containing protein [Phycisphaeraceae bacterium JB051]